MSEIATFGGGCFWCIEAIIRRLKGVVSVVSGYAGGHTEQPTYSQVCSGMTGHAEVVQITFDPQAISYTTLLDVFFSLHNPTTLNQQGNDRGTQYRSIILYHSEEQKHRAYQVIQDFQKKKMYEMPIVTEIVPYTTFYPAESYHQQYYDQHGYEPYCQVVIDPKIAKLRASFSHLLNPLS